MDINIAGSGCGTIWPCYLGVDQALRDLGLKVKEKVLTSGATIGLGLSSFYLEPEFILEELCRKIRDSRSKSFQFLVDYSYNPFDRFGFIKGDIIRKLILSYTDAKMSESNTRLKFVTTDWENMSEVIIDSELDLILVADAMRASIAMQGIIKEFRIKDKMLSDGALVRNYPIDLVSDSNPIFGIRLLGQQDYKQHMGLKRKEGIQSVFNPIIDVANIPYSRFLFLLNTLFRANEREHIEDAIFASTITIKTDFNGFSFSHNEGDVKRMFYDGYTQTKEWFRNKYDL